MKLPPRVRDTYTRPMLTCSPTKRTTHIALLLALFLALSAIGAGQHVHALDNGQQVQLDCPSCASGSGACAVETRIARIDASCSHSPPLSRLPVFEGERRILSARIRAPPQLLHIA